MVVIRLSRGGSKARPFYSSDVADKHVRHVGRSIERMAFTTPAPLKAKRACAWRKTV